MKYLDKKISICVNQNEKTRQRRQRLLVPQGVAAFSLLSVFVASTALGPGFPENKRDPLNWGTVKQGTLIISAGFNLHVNWQNQPQSAKDRRKRAKVERHIRNKEGTSDTKRYRQAHQQGGSGDKTARSRKCRSAPMRSGVAQRLRNCATRFQGQHKRGIAAR
jgi:hypothetical protein